MSKIFDFIRLNPWQSALKFGLIIWLCSIAFENSVYQISTIYIIVLAILHVVIYKNFSVLIANLKEVKLFSFFVFLIIVSMVIANLLNPELLTKKSWRNIIIFVTRYGFVFIALAYFYKLKFFSKKEIILYLLLGTSILLVSAIYQVINNPDLILSKNVSDIKKTGLTGLLDNRNRLGFMMGIGAVFSLIFTKYKPKLGIVLFLLHISVLVFTYSRSSWVGVSAAMLLWVALNLRKNIKFILLVLILFSLIVLGIYFYFDAVAIRFNHLLTGHTSYRDIIWEYTITQIQNNPIFGHGVQTWISLEKPKKLMRFLMVHNAELEILLFTGIFGLLAWLGVLFCAIKEIFRSKNFIYFCALAYFCIVIQFDFSLFDTKRLMSYLSLFAFLIFADKFTQKAGA
ncbi:O-antigen ligase family protein [Campylobacter sp. JMF_08 NE1]|uniref:O-antigen ligase family protein n=1 Tax=Campylobacter sp. JMF_08 NE1 TaxID=2983821 RepID=UPI0022E9CAB6|nr:O-antigen ligase family protein [Campylobacter sp. JMF_08 NE1]MDA3047182.1 O-antigen ligase family protein [Campylobacter sp. JMF_08 NE1]